MKTTRWLTALVLCSLAPLSGCRNEGTALAPPARSSEPASFAVTAGPAKWSAPVNLGPAVNSPDLEQTPTLSPDGLSLYFLSNRPGGQGNEDLWVSHRASRESPWGPAVNLGPTVNTSFGEAAPYITRDGHRLYFVSNRPGGLGGWDIMVSRRVHRHDDFDWGTPVNIGAPVNTLAFEGGMTTHGDELYFSAGADFSTPSQIYRSLIRGRRYTARELVQALSSAADDRRPSVRFDGRELFFHSTRAGGVGLHDLWVSTRPTDGRPWSTPVNLGPIVNSPSPDVTPSISPDGEELYFASIRPDGSGGFDLYVSRRVGRISR